MKEFPRQDADKRIHGPVGNAYAAYDSDARVNGPEDFEAFADAMGALGRADQDRITRLILYVHSLEEIVRFADVIDHVRAMHLQPGDLIVPKTTADMEG